MDFSCFEDPKFVWICHQTQTQADHLLRKQLMLLNHGGLERLRLSEYSLYGDKHEIIAVKQYIDNRNFKKLWLK